MYIFIIIVIHVLVEVILSGQSNNLQLDNKGASSKRSIYL